MSGLRFFGLLFLAQFVFSMAFAEEFSYDSHGKRDPFSISKGTKITLEDSSSKINIKLEGVVVDPKGHSVAVINGEMVGEGDKIGDQITVKKITNQGVEFESDGKTFNIPIAPKDE